MNVVVITERNGTVVVWTANSNGPPRQRAALDLDGSDLAHPDLVEFALDLSRRFGWDGSEIDLSPRKVTAKALSPRRTLSEEQKERQRQYSRDSARRKREREMAARTPQIAPKRKVRSPEEAREFRERVVQDIAAHPGTVIREVAERLGEPDANTTVYAKQMIDTGRLRREGEGTTNDPHRWYVVDGS